MFEPSMNIDAAPRVSTFGDVGPLTFTSADLQKITQFFKRRA